MSYDGDVHETRRNIALAIGVAVAAVTMVGLLYWLFSNMSGPALAVSPTAATTSTTSATAAPAPSQTTEAPPPPTIASWTPTTTFSLPPPEQPTMTSPVAGQTADQPSAPATTQAAPPPPPPPAPAGPTVSNVNLQCSKNDGKRVTAKLSFATSAKVDVVLSAGGQVDRKSAGPGNVSLSSAGRGPEICFAKIGDQTVGPVQAS
ncbi:MAG TPA: hypothetical protein VIG79_11425 [Lapillicoccus sp.]|jgi:hypothetical protein|uniref:hypothetical protein n=1 Tax=Lapillicoccus sp. TaxID=1909287 RepID=UPI002F937B6F